MSLPDTSGAPALNEITSSKALGVATTIETAFDSVPPGFLHLHTDIACKRHVCRRHWRNTFLRSTARGRARATADQQYRAGTRRRCREAGSNHLQRESVGRTRINAAWMQG